MDLFVTRLGGSEWGLVGGPLVSPGPCMFLSYGNGNPCGRWTCPKASRYSIRGAFTGIDPSGVDSFVYVVINDAIMYSNQVQSYRQTVTFTNDNVSLNQGDFVDFTLVWGGQVSIDTDATDVDAVISEWEPAPPTLRILLPQLELCWTTETNAWYQLQYRCSLMAGQWIPLTTNWVSGDGARFCTADAMLPGQPQRFYRVVATNSAPQL